MGSGRRMAHASRGRRVALLRVNCDQRSPRAGGVSPSRCEDWSMFHVTRGKSTNSPAWLRGGDPRDAVAHIHEIFR